MSNLGLGVLIQQLGGNEKSARTFQASIGKTIKSIKIDPDANYGDGALKINFTESGIQLYDKGRSCCEERYLHTDDNLDDFIDATLVDGEVKEGPTTQDEYGDPHEVAFLTITTSKGAFTIETHNIHNGYYGGFWVECRELEDE
jgi:hypothetical protein